VRQQFGRANAYVFERALILDGEIVQVKLDSLGSHANADFAKIIYHPQVWSHHLSLSYLNFLSLRPTEEVESYPTRLKNCGIPDSGNYESGTPKIEQHYLPIPQFLKLCPSRF